MSDALAAAFPYLGWAAAFVATLGWRRAASALQSTAIARSQERDQAAADIARLEGAVTSASGDLSSARQQLAQARAQVRHLTQHVGRTIEHEGSHGTVRARVLSSYESGGKRMLHIRTEPQPRRPSISYDVALDQCRFVDTDPAPPLPR